MTAVTKIVLRSQWGWWGGVKKLFRWINSPSHTVFFSPHCLACIRDTVSVDLKASYHRCICAFTVFAVKHDGMWHGQIGLSDPRGDLAASSGAFWVKRRGPHFVQQPRELCISLSGISSESFTPFSHHLPRRLRGIPLLTSPPLMPFSIDHYPPFPLATVSERSIRNAGPPPWSLLCDRCSREVKRLRSGRLAVCFVLIYGVRVRCGLIGRFELPVMMIQMWPEAIVADSVWTCVSMTAGVLAVDKVPCFTSVQFYDLTNTDDLLKASPLPIIFPSFCSFPSPDAAPPLLAVFHWPTALH